MNSPNITMNVDTNRVGGAGAGGVAVTVNTITIAETMLPEYAAGGTNAIVLSVQPGYQFDPTSPVSAQSATIGLNNNAVNVAATLTPTGNADETLTFMLTSGTSASVQDIIRVNGIRVRIISAAGAAGPAQVTMRLTTSTAGGAFTDQGIVAANITRGAPDHLEFSAQPGTTQSGEALLPAVKIVDFGGNLIADDPRFITLNLEENPGGATLLGINSFATQGGIATWTDADNLNIATAAMGYTLRASHDGANFLTSDTVESIAFDITAGPANRLEFTVQPTDTDAGETIVLAVTVLDAVGNTVTTPDEMITLDSTNNPGGWPLLVDTSLTKETVAGVATWDETDRLRIQRAVNGYRLVASGVGTPVESGLFDVFAASPAVLRFVEQPTETSVVLAIDPPISVEILDAFANRTMSTATVNLNLQSGCGGTLTGGAATANAGLAVFNDVRIDTACAGIVLEAASGDLPRVDSTPFTVLALPPVALRFVQQPTNVAADVALNPQVTVEIVDAAGQRTDSMATVELTLLASCGGAITTMSASAVGGLATFSMLAVDTPCAAVTLQATADGLTGDTSQPFDVTAAPAAALRFVQQPTMVQEGAAFNPPISVEVIDATGERTDSTATVALTLLSSCGGTLSTTTANAVGGLATFPMVSVDTACAAVSLQATSDNLTGTTSSAFDVTALEMNNACGLCGQGALLAFIPMAGMRWCLRRRPGNSKRRRCLSSNRCD